MWTAEVQDLMDRVSKLETKVELLEVENGLLAACLRKVSPDPPGSVGYWPEAVGSGLKKIHEHGLELGKKIKERKWKIGDIVAITHEIPRLSLHRGDRGTIFAVMWDAAWVNFIYTVTLSDTTRVNLEENDIMEVSQFQKADAELRKLGGEFKTDDRVSFDMGEGTAGTGTVLGLSFDHIVKMWIVLLDKPIVSMGSVHKAIVVQGSLMRAL